MHKETSSSAKPAKHPKATPVFVDGVPKGTVDFYFWHVQSNPIDNNTLLAIFPVSQPPRACIGIAFSTNGVDFSQPLNLQQRAASLGWRTRRGSK